jgi:hypothetical protein
MKPNLYWTSETTAWRTSHALRIGQNAVVYVVEWPTYGWFKRKGTFYQIVGAPLMVEEAVKAILKYKNIKQDNLEEMKPVLEEIVKFWYEGFSLPEFKA